MSKAIRKRRLQLAYRTMLVANASFNTFATIQALWPITYVTFLPRRTMWAVVWTILTF